MSHYLFAVYMSTEASGADHSGPAMSPEQMQSMMQGIVDLEAEMDSQDALVFSGRLSEPSAATVVRSADSGAMTTDGPFAESKEMIAGFYIVEAGGLEEALDWAKKVSAAVGAPIEVRPFAATGRVADQMGERAS